MVAICAVHMRTFYWMGGLNVKNDKYSQVDPQQKPWMAHHYFYHL